MENELKFDKINTYPIIEALSTAIQVAAWGFTIFMVILGCFTLWRMLPDPPLRTCPHLCERCNLLDEKASQIYREKRGGVNTNQPLIMP